MRILTAGASGFLGTALVTRLRAAGHEVVRLVRRDPRDGDERRWSPGREPLDPALLAGVDAVVNLAGAGVADRRWNQEYQAVLRDSRLESTGTLARALADAGDGPRVLLNASAVGFYGDRGEAELTEQAPAGQGFFARLCQDWEAATGPAAAAGVRVVHLRTGLVLGPSGGLLAPLLPLFRLGLGGRLGSGRQWMPWISLADEIGAIEHLLAPASTVSGAVNLTAPAPVRNSEFTQTLGRVLHRPAVLPVPAAAMRLAVGGFAAEALASQRVLPRRLAGDGYAFEHPDLSSALHWALHQALRR